MTRLTFSEFITEAATIGKRMGHDLYVHKNYEHVLPSKELEAAKGFLPTGFNYTAVKHNKKERTFSFIQSSDFDAADEPTVGDSIKVHPSGKTTLTKQSKDPKIWHHKWQWVAPDYTGFDVEASKERSKKWRGVVGTNKELSSRIGSRSYWDANVVPLIKEQTEVPDIGININNDDIPFADLIADGHKKYETRRMPTLNKFIGQTVGIIKTSKKSKAKAIGHVTVGAPMRVGYEEFNTMRDQHHVPAGSKFDCEKNGFKWLYPMENPARWDHEKDVENKGFVIISRKIKK